MDDTRRILEAQKISRYEAHWARARSISYGDTYGPIPEEDLNALRMNNAEDGPSELPQTDYGCYAGKSQASVIFKNLAPRLVDYIDQAEAVIGCVAWLTHPNILAALAKKPASIIVQKEDLWRPDVGQSRRSKTDLREAYLRVNKVLERIELPGIVPSLSSHTETADESAVRCVGNLNSAKNPAHPRMHHKFLVFCEYKTVSVDQDFEFTKAVPYAVWTGSFNFTYNAGRSFENALYVRDKELADAYAREFAQVYAFSEPLDWEAEWVHPEHRIGS